MKAHRIALAALVAATLPALASAALVIDPVPADGPAVVITGSGANANGYVELFINGASSGSVQADGSGNFSFTRAVADNDVLTAIPARVWNFASDGDAEGWFSPDDTITVAGGVMTVTEVAGGNMTIAFNGAALADPTVQRVLEIGYRLTGTATAPGIILTNSNAGGPFGPNYTPTPSAGFRVDLVDLTDLGSTDQANTPNLGWSGIVDQIGVGFNGPAIGDTLEVEFIRLRETYRFDFAIDGDTQGFVADSGPGQETTISGVSGGFLTAVPNGTNKGISIVPSFQQVNSSVFVNHNVRMIQNANVAVQPAQVGSISFYYNGFSAWAVDFLSTGVYTPDYGNPITVSTALTGSVNWQDPLNAIHLPNVLMFAPEGTESAVVDYIEWAPASVIGDAAPVVVGVTSVSDWTLLGQ